jgi:homoserine kinase type II
LDDVLYGPRADPALAEELIAHYPINTPTAFYDLGGTYNLNALVESHQGQYVLRVHRPWVSARRLSYLQQVKHQLALAGFPVVLPISTRSGADILSYGSDPQRLVELEPYVIHDAQLERWSDYPQAFALLGQIHTALDRLPATVQYVPPAVSNYALPAQLLHWTHKTMKVIEQERTTGRQRAGDAQHALDICETVLPFLQTLDRWWRSEGQHLPQGLTHGDYGGGNILLSEGQIVALLDFDFLDQRERIFDLAYTIYWIFWLHEDTRYPELAPWNRVNTLLEAYNQHTQQPLTPQERQALPLEIARIPLYWIAEAHFLPNPVQTVLALADPVAYALRIYNQRQTLAQTFT